MLLRTPESLCQQMKHYITDSSVYFRRFLASLEDICFGRISNENRRLLECIAPAGRNLRRWTLPDVLVTWSSSSSRGRASLMSPFVASQLHFTWTKKVDCLQQIMDDTDETCSLRAIRGSPLSCAFVRRGKGRARRAR